MSEKKQETENTEIDAGAEAERILTEAKAEADKIIADAKAKAADEKKHGSVRNRAAVPASDPGEELVEYTLPLLGPEKDQDVFVGVNGKTIRIQRGKTVRIQRKFAEVLRNAQAQEYAARRAMEDARKQSARAAADL